MEKGDIASWSNNRFIIVLEGILVEPKYQSRIVRKDTLMPASEWDWQIVPIKYMVNYASRLNVTIEVVTFMGEEVATAAADWLSTYGIHVSECISVDFEIFCRSLIWRINEVERVIDSDPDRIHRYGQLGYAAVVGRGF